MIPSYRVRALMFQFRANLNYFSLFDQLVRSIPVSQCSLSINLSTFFLSTHCVTVCVCVALGGDEEKKRNESPVEIEADTVNGHYDQTHAHLLSH